MNNQEMIESLCHDLKLGSHISKIHDSISADTHEEYLVEVLKSCQNYRAASSQVILAKHILKMIYLATEVV